MAVGVPRPSPARRASGLAACGGASPNRPRRVNRDRAQRPDTASLAQSARRSCPRPSADWLDPRRTGDPGDSAQSVDRGGYWKPAASACVNEHAGRLRASIEQPDAARTPAPWPSFSLDAAMTIDPIHLVVDGSDLLAQTPIRHLSHRRWSLLPGIETLRDTCNNRHIGATGNDQPTPRWRETSLRGLREDGERLFKTSRSMVTWASCRRRRRSSALATLLAVARKGIVTLLLVLALPFAQQVSAMPSVSAT